MLSLGKLIPGESCYRSPATCQRSWGSSGPDMRRRPAITSCRAGIVHAPACTTYLPPPVSLNLLESRPEAYLGSAVTFPHFSTQNRRGPLLPRKAAKPSYGILDVPVTNCGTKRTTEILQLKSWVNRFNNPFPTWSSLSLCSLLNLSTAAQNHRITMWLSW